MSKQNLDDARYPELADYLLDQRDFVTRQWMAAVRKHPAIVSVNGMTREELADHLPSLYDDLAGLLRDGGSWADWSALRDAQSHGQHRWRQGFSLEEIFRELSLMRGIFMREIFAGYRKTFPELAAKTSRDAKVKVQEFFDRLAAESVEQYVTEQQRQGRELSEELMRKNALMSELSESRITLMRVISHELRNALHAQGVAITLLARQDDADQRADLFEMCQRTLADMTVILDQLLDYSALVAEREEVQAVAFGAREFFDELVMTWRPAIEEKGMRFEGTCDPDPGEIVTDRLKLKQIAGNLVSNAIKYQKPDGGGMIAIRMGVKDGETWTLSVIDEGIGIAEADRGKLFREFSRISPRDGVSGSGLGLAITKRLVELLGGSIAVESELGVGSCFEVTLPRRLVANAPATPASDPEANIRRLEP